MVFKSSDLFWRVGQFVEVFGAKVSCAFWSQQWFFPLYLQTGLTLLLSVILHLSCTFSLALYWLSLWKLIKQQLWSNIAISPKIQLEIHNSICSVIVSEACQSACKRQSPLHYNKKVSRSLSLVITAFWFGHGMHRFPSKILHSLSANTWELIDLSSGSSHKFCQKHVKIPRSEKCHKIYTSLITNLNLIVVDAVGDVLLKWMFQGTELRGHHVWSGCKVQSSKVHAQCQAQLPKVSKG